jgi:hypothetical protein
MNEQTSGLLTLTSNNYLNLTITTENSPNNSLPLISLKNMNHYTVSQSNERYEGIKAHRIISIKHLSMYNAQNTTFIDVRSP